MVRPNQGSRMTEQPCSTVPINRYRSPTETRHPKPEAWPEARAPGAPYGCSRAPGAPGAPYVPILKDFRWSRTTYRGRTPIGSTFL